MESISRAAPLVGIYRGGVLESLQRGHVAVVADARLVAETGDAKVSCFLRSCSKFQQAVPVVLSGAADQFRLSTDELAILCASHRGLPEQIARVESILLKAGVSAGDLQCGAHIPYGESARNELIRTGQKPTALHNNCSGKHAGMLALAQHLSAPLANYHEFAHPVQQLVARSIAQFAEFAAEPLVWAVDGCGIPTFQMQLRHMAGMTLRFVEPGNMDDELTTAARRLRDAVVQFPELIGGAGEIDTEVIRVTRGRVICKIGAEGLAVFASRPSTEYPHGLGGAIKIEDGHSERARPLVLIESLRQLELLDRAELDELNERFSRNVKNNRGEIVGELRPLFTLARTR